MYFNGKPSVDRVKKWILLARLKQEVMKSEEKEFECPICKKTLYYCDCEKDLANNILHDILKHEINKVEIN